MNVRIVAFVASRLFAIYLLVTYVANYLVQGGVAALLVKQTDFVSQNQDYLKAMLFVTVTYIVIAIAFWFGSGWIADRVAKPLPDKVIGTLDVNQWRPLVVAAIGVLFFMRGTEFFNQLYNFQYRGDPDRDELTAFAVYSGLFYTFVGLALIALARTIGSWSRSIISVIKALREWLNRPAFRGDDQ